MGAALKISSYGPHYGEEPELVGFTASGTIFLTGCNLLCNFCQNHDISHERNGRFTDEDTLVEIMLNLQNMGAANINFVTPTHFSPQLINAAEKAKSYELNIPIVYNSSGYDKVKTLKMWEGIIDIYMPDLKFFEPEKSKLYADAPDYFDFASKAIIEMHRQVGDLVIRNGVAQRGLLVRHLVLPNNQSDTKEIIDFIAENIGINTYLNLMDQYRPAYRAFNNHLISERLIWDQVLVVRVWILRHLSVRTKVYLLSEIDLKLILLLLLSGNPTD
jgi:putative pyruvate formate lyase activating enzyme